jgi:hypothetical protein
MLRDQKAETFQRLYRNSQMRKKNSSGGGGTLSSGRKKIDAKVTPAHSEGCGRRARVKGRDCDEARLLDAKPLQDRILWNVADAERDCRF